MTLDLAADLIRASGVDDAERLVGLLRPSVRVRAERLNRPLHHRGSTFGGRPFLPVGAEWPHWDSTAYHESQLRYAERMAVAVPASAHWPKAIAAAREQLRQPRLPLNFLADINLAEVPSVAGADRRPMAGRLLFFYDIERCAAGFDPADRGACLVLHLPANAKSAQVDPPPGLEVFPTSVLSFDVQHMLAPDMRTYGVEAHVYDDGPFESLYAELAGDSPPVHRLGGYADPVQNAMELECQLVTNGLYCGDQTGYQDPRRALLEPGAKDWRLLLQLDSDHDVGWMWGDVGRLYFWIHADDLRDGNFSDVWCIFQCH